MTDLQLGVIGNSAVGFSEYFSVNFSMASWTMSSAPCSSRTANIACLNARRSTSARKADISWVEARARVRPGDSAHYRAQSTAAGCASQRA